MRPGSLCVLSVEGTACSCYNTSKILYPAGGVPMDIFIPGERFHNYITALEALGARVRFDRPEDCAGLLLPGGWDVHPGLYGEEIAGSRGIDEERDAREMELIDMFRAAGKPVLGICRGMQILNVAFGGSLYQDIDGHRETAQGDTIHGSRTDDPMLTALYGERFPVNSSHHQAAARPGEGLRPVQWADDGTVEALRHETLPIFGVQWHPERMRQPTDGWLLIARWLLTI